MELSHWKENVPNIVRLIIGAKGLFSVLYGTLYTHGMFTISNATTSHEFEL